MKFEYNKHIKLTLKQTLKWLIRMGDYEAMFLKQMDSPPIADIPGRTEFRQISDGRTEISAEFPPKFRQNFHQS